MQVVTVHDTSTCRRESDVTSDSQRAPRYPVHVPMRYRSMGAARWSSGRIENISRSGVLFRTDQLLAVDTPLEMSFALPLGGSTAAGIICVGRIVRTVGRAGNGDAPGLAATISTYRFFTGPMPA